MKTKEQIELRLKQIDKLAKKSCDKLIKRSNIHDELFPDVKYSHGLSQCLNSFKTDIYLELANMLRWVLEDENKRKELIILNKRKINKRKIN